MKNIPLFLLFAAITLTASAQSAARDAGVFQSAKIHAADHFVYPATLIRLGVTSGEVRAIVSIDERGKLADFLVVASTHDDFTQAVTSGLSRCAFEPARWNETPVPIVMPVDFDFRREGLAVTSLTASEVLQLEVARPRLWSDASETLADLRPLDRAPQPMRTVSPLRPETGVGEATFRFYIDETGAVRMPTVVSMTSENMARAALDALLQWRFEPPLRRGRPVIAQVSQQFVFPAGGETPEIPAR